MSDLAEVFLICVAVFTLLAVMANRNDARIWRQLRADRKGLAPDGFLDYFREQGISTAIADLVRIYIQDETGADFPMLPGDSIADMYLMVDEDLDDAVYDLISLCGRIDVPGPLEFEGVDVTTVEDLVRLVDRLSAAGEHGLSARNGLIDRESRDALALLIRRFVTRRISIGEFRRLGGQLPWNRRDGAIPGILSDVEACLDTYGDHLPPQARPVFVRMIAFLYSDRPYEWRWQKGWTTGEAVAFCVSLALGTALLLTPFSPYSLGPFLFALIVALWPQSERHTHREARPGQSFPFRDRVELVAVRRRPRLLAGTRDLSTLS